MNYFLFDETMERGSSLFYNVAAFSSEPMYLALTNMAEKYGDIFTIYMGE